LLGDGKVLSDFLLGAFSGFAGFAASAVFGTGASAGFVGEASAGFGGRSFAGSSASDSGASAGFVFFFELPGSSFTTALGLFMLEAKLTGVSCSTEAFCLETSGFPFV